MAIILEEGKTRNGGCTHSYSKSWKEPRPRKCRKCGKLEYEPHRMSEQQLLESSPIAFLDSEPIKSNEETLKVLYEIVRALHRLHDSGNEHNLYRYINEDDFHSIWLYLTKCWNGMDTQIKVANNKLKEEKQEVMGVKPLSPDEVVYDIPDFVIEAVNEMIKNKFRGSSFSFKAKELIALGRSKGATGSNKDWYKEKWMDFENIYREMGWVVSYSQPSYGDSNFDAYYEFTPKTKK